MAPAAELVVHQLSWTTESFLETWIYQPWYSSELWDYKCLLLPFFHGAPGHYLVVPPNADIQRMSGCSDQTIHQVAALDLIVVFRKTMAYYVSV